MPSESLYNNNNNRESNDGKDELLGEKWFGGDTQREINIIATIK
jgi:hypothetical protein